MSEVRAKQNQNTLHELDHPRLANSFRKFVGEVAANKVDVIAFKVSTPRLMENYHYRHHLANWELKRLVSLLDTRRKLGVYPMKGGKSGRNHRHRGKQRLSYLCSNPYAVNSFFKRSDRKFGI